MRRIALLFSVCLAVSVAAADQNSTLPVEKSLKSESLKLKMQIPKPEAPARINSRPDRAANLRTKIAAESQNSVHEKENSQTSYRQDMKGLRAFAKESGKQQLDSVVAILNSTGRNVSHQYFTYDEHNLPKHRINALWNKTTQTWESAEEYGYQWDEDGYCLSQWGINTQYDDGGQKYDFTYNDRKWGITQIISNYVNGKWVPSEKGVYTYDDRGNIIEEYIYLYDESKSDWVFANHNKVSYDAKNRQTSWEGYSWDNTEWVPTGEKQEYAYDDNGHPLLYSFYLWQPETKDWLNYHRVEQTFENNLITVQEEKYWNKSTQTWDGVEEYNGAELYNTKTDFQYDDQGREIYAIAYKAETLEKGYEKRVDMEYTYTPLDNGGTKLFCKTFFYTGGTAKELTGELTKEFNANNQITYAYERQLNKEVGAWVAYYEEKYQYNDAGNLLGSRYWIYELTKENKKLADISEEYIFDDNQNIIDSYYQSGQGTGEEDWVNISRFTYKYEQDTVRVEKLAYIWDENRFLPNWGEACSFDYTVPVENLILWIGDKAYHKITETRSYMGANEDWDYLAFTYYYSDKETGIDEHATNLSVSVYPNPVTDLLNIRADEEVDVVIYNIQGARLLNTSEKQINLSGFLPGVYIVEVNGVKTKVIKE